MSAELRNRVAKALSEEVAPILELDGAELEVLDVADGIARVRMTGACASCPATIMTLIMGMERELRARVPEVEFLEAVA